MIVGIDASNIRLGGGLTHLSCLLDVVRSYADNGQRRVVVWGGKRSIERLTGSKVVELIHVPALDGPLPLRMAWQQWILPGNLRRYKCDVLFSPGGILPHVVDVPTIVMSQNLLPFESAEYKRFSLFSFMRWKMPMVAVHQRRSMEQADGLIFLTQYARDTVLHSLSKHTPHVAVIPHGLESRFFCPPRPAIEASCFSNASPFRLLYVSIVDMYKHQWQVAKAVASMRADGIPIMIEFIGPNYRPALNKLTTVMDELDPERQFLHYRGAVTFGHLHEVYRKADAFVFASSCENLPNILLEAMASGLPIACSRKGPMPEVLGAGGVYFDPERPEEIRTALLEIYENASLRQDLAEKAFTSATGSSWDRCARETFGFIEQVANEVANQRKAC